MKEFTITYSSGLTPDPALLGALVILADKVYLPQPYGVSWETRKLCANWGGNFDQERAYFAKKYAEWKSGVQPLFDAGALQLVPDVFENETPRLNGKDILSRLQVSDSRQFDFSEDDLKNDQIKFYNEDVLSGRVALAVHFAADVAPGSRFVWKRDIQDSKEWLALSRRNVRVDPTSTESIRLALLKALLREERIPIFNEFDPERILEIRKETRAKRAALVASLDALADQVERRVRDGVELDEAADRTIARDLFPEYLEFQRKYRKEIRSKFLKSLQEFAKIDVGWSSPAFYTKLVKAILNISRDASDAAVSAATNRQEAFCLLGTLRGRATPSR